ncbi:thioredoxin family protein [Oleiagrimonas sp. C23AA]|uniref:thioredoxin family protein n=1 Tax=Oleiagrimonas sp. C23AA TaxID=2719047 RepID=UPI001422DBFC|nr:thioredoxin family protein [Oleiagrimonas sp. C23AA]NII09300.1 thioredoxin family protein [Oleiagrimonas sp. C23AA]
MPRQLRILLATLALVVTACAGATPSQAPEFAGISHWINSPPLTMKQLRGKVVLVDFWTYSCINCLRTLPHLKSWYAKYHDKGLEIVGVHSPEFDFEKNYANVKRAVNKYGITWPVAMDSDMRTWRAWNNHYWPAEYLIDKQGKVIESHFGEGNYEQTENAIRKALGMGSAQMDEHAADLSGIGSPEMYFGLDREEYMAPPQRPSAGARMYTTPDTIGLNQFALTGRWKMTGQYAQLVGDKGQIHLHFKSGKLHMVASAEHPVTLKITVDGKPQPNVTVRDSQLYTLFDSNSYEDHVVTIRVVGSGFKAFTFTFG